MFQLNGNNRYLFTEVSRLSGILGYFYFIYFPAHFLHMNMSTTVGRGGEMSGSTSEGAQSQPLGNFGHTCTNLFHKFGSKNSSFQLLCSLHASFMVGDFKRFFSGGKSSWSTTAADIIAGHRKLQLLRPNATRLNLLLILRITREQGEGASRLSALHYKYTHGCSSFLRFSWWSDYITLFT